MYVLKCCSAESHSRCNIHQTAVHQDYISCIDGDIGPCSDGYAYISSGQCRSVIYTVADHDSFTLFLKQSYGFFLTVRQNSRDHIVNTCRLSDSTCRALIIACQHHHSDAHILQLSYSLRTVFFYHIRYRYHAHKCVISSKEQRCLSFGRQVFSLPFCCLRHFKLLICKGQASCCKDAFVILCGKAVARQDNEFFNVEWSYTT